MELGRSPGGAKKYWQRSLRRGHVLRLGAALVLALAGGAPAQTYRVLKNFTGADGSVPQGTLVLSGSTLYGTTAQGGSSSNGVVFKIDTDGSGYQVLKSFTGASDGSGPQGGMVLVDSTLYGMTLQGGSSGNGVIFKINPDGSGYQVVTSFPGGTNGAYPQGDLLLAGRTLYGVTQHGGGFNSGVIFRINTNGSAYTALQSCSTPNGGLALADGTLYGTTLFGGNSPPSSAGSGTVFKMNTDGSGYSILKAFSFTDGANPAAGLALGANTLYGTTSDGGGTGRGVVFSVNTDGTGFAVLKSFNGTDGSSPQGGLVLASNILYGTTSSGGDSYASNNFGYGVVFQINTDGTGFAVLKSFSGSDGANPMSDLVSAGTVLYGTTSAGGSSGCGVVFALDWLGPTPPTIVQPPQDLTAPAGDSVALNVQVANIQPLAYQWVCNGTNVLDGATNSVLQLTNLQPTQSGAYAVILTNSYGALTSSPALLEVIPLGTTPVASCTQGALRAALAGPGPVTFACDGAILLTNTLVISSDIVVDGSGHWVTLSGGNLVQVIGVNSNVTFSALNLTIANGVSTNGGAIYNAGGTVNLTNCTFVGNCARGTSSDWGATGGNGDGGAIYSSGSVNASLCAFLGNAASGGAGGEGGTIITGPWWQPIGGPGGPGGQANGGAICSSGMLTVDHSLFAGNTVAGGPGGPGGDGTDGYKLGTGGGDGGNGGDGSGAAVFNSGMATLLNCTLAGDACLGGPGGPGGQGAYGWAETTHWTGRNGLSGNNGHAGNATDSQNSDLNVTNCPVAFNSGTLQFVPTLSGGPVILVSGAAGDTCRLLVSPDLLNWTAVATNHFGPNGTLLFNDPGALGQAQRFYSTRNAVRPGPQPHKPILKLHRSGMEGLGEPPATGLQSSHAGPMELGRAGWPRRYSYLEQEKTEGTETNTRFLCCLLFNIPPGI